VRLQVGLISPSSGWEGLLQQQGIPFVQQAIQVKPQVASYHNLLGDLFYGLENYAQAIVHYKDAITQDGKGRGGFALTTGQKVRHAIAVFVLLATHPRMTGGAYGEMGFFSFNHR